MSAQLTRRGIAALAAADLLFFGGWMVREERGVRGARLQFPIEGYDPRDLLSGHYVRFKLVAEDEAQAIGAADAYCLSENTGPLHLTRARAAGDDCRPFLGVQAGPSSPGRPALRFGVDRFYLDERKAGAAARIRAGPKTWLEATVDAEGRLHPVDLVVDGKSLKE